MIWGLFGKIKYMPENAIVIETSGGVFYKAAISKNTRQTILTQNKETIELMTIMAVREDAVELYGFAEESEKKLFELLTTVNGVGPKAAMSVLSSGSLGEIRAAISEGKVEVLTKSVGVGRKTAERIVMELKSKVIAELGDKVQSWDEDVYDALIRLGYGKEQVKKAVLQISPEIEDITAKIREALKYLK